MIVYNFGNAFVNSQKLSIYSMKFMCFSLVYEYQCNFLIITCIAWTGQGTARMAQDFTILWTLWCENCFNGSWETEAMFE